MSCPHCLLRDGYPPPEDVETILNECPPHYISIFAQAIRDHRAGKATGGGSLHFDGSNGETQDWGVDLRTKVKYLTQRVKRA